MLARDFMLRLEPKPLPNPNIDVVTHVLGADGWKIKTENVPNRVKFFFEHNTEKITEEMWCKLLSFGVKYKMVGTLCSMPTPVKTVHFVAWKHSKDSHPKWTKLPIIGFPFT